MPDVNVKIGAMYPHGTQGGIRAYASATVDGCLAIRGIRIIEGGKDGMFVSMPSRKTESGYREICFPVTKEFRDQLHSAVLDAYQQAVVLNQTASQNQGEAQNTGQQQEASQPSMQMSGM